MRAIRMVFVSTNALTRSGIGQLLAQTDPPIEVAGAFSNFESARQYLDVQPADVILIDDSLPRHTNLLQEMKALQAGKAGIAVIIILQRPTADLAIRLLNLGVRGILQKNDDLERYIPQAIMLGKQRGIYLSPSVSYLVDMQRQIPAGFTQRHIDVLRLLAEGSEIEQIASQLGVKQYTVYRSIRALRLLLNAQSNAHMIALAHQKGLLHAGTSAE
jgi:two-component system capsular synthesis response regulator RcsB